MRERSRGDRDHEAERLVAGTLLTFPERAEEIAYPGDDAFTLPGMGELVSHLMRQGDTGRREPADLVELVRVLGPTASLLGGLHGIADLAARHQLATPAALARHVQYLELLARIRRLGLTCAEIAEDSREARDPETFVERAAAKLDQVTDASGSKPVRMVGDVSAAVLSDLFAGKARGIETGFTELDRLTLGLGRGNLVVIAGRPSMGKSALALDVLRGTGCPGIVFQLEMSDHQMVQRMLCREGMVDMSRARHGSLDERERGDLVRAEARLQRMPIAIADEPGQTIAEIRARARQFVRKYRRTNLAGEPTDCVVVIDYLQLVRPVERSGSREQDVAEISRGAKMLALELKIPVLLLSQLSREVEKRPIPRPQLSDLRESGAIEQDADDVIFVWRPERYPQTNKPEVRGLAEVIVAKQRMGAIGAFELQFDGKFCAFRNREENRQ